MSSVYPHPPRSDMKSLSLAFLVLTFGPMTAGAQAAQAANASALPAHLRSWTTDHRDYAVGEVITVLISEQTVASDAGAAQNAHDRTFGLEGSADVGGLTDLPVDAVGAGASIGRSERDRDEIRRRDNFAGEIAVRILEITEDGLLRIEGERVVKIDNRTRRLTLTGAVRPADVSARGYVLSHRVADARIEYKGGPSRLRGGWLGRILGWLWPL